MSTKQLELDAVPRKRVQLLVDEPAAPAGGEVGDGAMGSTIERRPRRFLAESAAAVETEMAHAMKRALAAHGAASLQKMLPADESRLVDLLPMTEWFEGPPPCNGWWDVKTGFEDARLWFDAVGQQWRTDQGSWIGVGELTKSFKYRGLKQPYAKGYRYPVPGAKLARRVELVGA